MTPAKLAIWSVVIGCFPLFLSLLGVLLAKLLKCNVSAAGADKCLVLGYDVGNLLYTLMMMHWLFLITGGITVLGLVGAGIWTLVR
ncbi:hypothetical protein [Gallaecimonas sp. GXIMD4217]|uniref:hypothetical protein n=1 Tax=Gallaecimonas sp. GXIMD4217 TaxID=3131927 RepID=UPI00311B2448